jgi:hypothetical protein
VVEGRSVTGPEQDNLIVALVNAAAEESRRKNEALAKLLEMLEIRLERLERKLKKRARR